MNSAGEPLASIASISSWLRRRTYGSSDLRRRREKPWRVYTRMRLWSGSGRFDITAIGSKSGAASTSAAASLNGNTGSCTLADAYTSGLRKTASMSSMRVITR